MEAVEVPAELGPQQADGMPAERLGATQPIALFSDALPARLGRAPAIMA